MSEITIYIQPQSLTKKEFNGVPVVTFKDVDSLHQRPEGTARKRFYDNQQRFVEGEDYFLVNKTDSLKSEIQTSMR